jgi:hypothetical protein
MQNYHIVCNTATEVDLALCNDQGWWGCERATLGESPWHVFGKLMRKCDVFDECLDFCNTYKVDHS